MCKILLWCHFDSIVVLLTKLELNDFEMFKKKFYNVMWLINTSFYAYNLILNINQLICVIDLSHQKLASTIHFHINHYIPNLPQTYYPVSILSFLILIETLKHEIPMWSKMPSHKVITSSRFYYTINPNWLY